MRHCKLWEERKKGGQKSFLLQRCLERRKTAMANFISAEFGKADFVLLEELSTEAFMANLKLRYMKGKIYSYIGEVVVSVNPYRNLVIYDKEYVQVEL